MVSVLLERTNFRPGEAIRGRAFWPVSGGSEEVSVRLCWQTEGKGGRDSETVGVVVPDGGGAGGEGAFTMIAPDGPFSFSGKLISLIWSIEVVATPGGFARAEVTLSPDGEEIDLRRDDWIQMPTGGNYPWMGRKNKKEGT